MKNQRRLKFRKKKSRRLNPRSFVFPTQHFYPFRNIHWTVTVHLQNFMSNIEKGSRASSYQNRRNPGLFIQIPGPFQKRGNGFFFSLDHFLHKIIPHHKVCCRGILVNEKELRSCFYPLHDTGGLRGTSAGILRRKRRGILFIGQIINKKGNISIPDCPSLLCPQLHCCLLRNHKFPAVSCNMVINSHLKRRQKRRFSMITASYNQSDSLWNCHSAHLPPVGKGNGFLHRRRGNKGNAVSHGKIRNSAFSWKNGTIRYKSHQPLLL